MGSRRTVSGSATSTAPTRPTSASCSGRSRRSWSARPSCSWRSRWSPGSSRGGRTVSRSSSGCACWRWRSSCCRRASTSGTCTRCSRSGASSRRCRSAGASAYVVAVVRRRFLNMYVVLTTLYPDNPEHLRLARHRVRHPVDDDHHDRRAHPPRRRSSGSPASCGVGAERRLVEEIAASRVLDAGPIGEPDDGPAGDRRRARPRRSSRPTSRARAGRPGRRRRRRGVPAGNCDRGGGRRSRRSAELGLAG